MTRAGNVAWRMTGRLPGWLVVALVLLGAASAGAPAGAASFDCRKARTADEKAICASPLLSELDELVALFYTRLRRYSGAFDNAAGLQGQLLAEQRAFLRRRAACGGRERCLEREHRARLRELLRRWMLAMGGREGGGRGAAMEKSRDADFSCTRLRPWRWPAHRDACPDAPDDPQLVETWRLGSGKVACAVPCFVAAYNVGVRAYLVDARTGKIVKELVFPKMRGGGGLTRELEIVSPSFDTATKEVHSFNRGRGLGDCGEQFTWRWDGVSFELKEQRAKDECDGKRGPWRKVWPRQE